MDKERRSAVIDLGTNTFHLLIAEAGDQKMPFRVVYRDRRFVKLAEAGIEQIGPEAMARAVNTLSHFSKQLRSFEVHAVRAVGTAAMRSAANSHVLVERAKQELGLDIEIISGKREALLIYQGVQLLIPFFEQPKLVMDIGGGSVEFILATKTKVLWSVSFPVGVAILRHRFHRHEPIEEEEIKSIHKFLDREAAPLTRMLKIYPVSTLVGASGTFDVLETFLAAPGSDPAPYPSLAVSRFPDFYRQMRLMNLEERLQIADLPEARAEMIVAALVLIDWVLQQSPIEVIEISNFALKEGYLAELLAVRVSI